MTRPLRIAIASSGLGHVARGVEAWAQDVSAALHAREESVILYKGSGSPTRPYEVVVPCWMRGTRRGNFLLNLKPAAIRWRLGLGTPHGIEQSTFALQLLPHLRRQRADVLHVQDPLVALIVQRARRLGLVRTRTILAHGTEEPPAFLKKIDYLQHLAPWHLEQAKAAGAWRPRWTAIPNFIDTGRFAPGRADAVRAELGLPADAVVVMTAAAIKRSHKRIDHLISEFARLRAAAPDLPVWLVVAGGREADTDELIAEGTARLGDRVRFLVQYPRDRMPDLYRAADVFVLASVFEMMPLAVLEATASGLPSVVNRHPILEWMTGPGGAAVDMTRPGELADRLARLCVDPAARHALGTSGRRHCLDHFSKEAVIGQILYYYKQLAVTSASVAGQTGVGSCA